MRDGRVPNYLENFLPGSSQVIEKGSIKDTGALLDLTIAKISSADMHTAMESLVQIEEVFKRKKTEDEIIRRMDQVYTLFSFYKNNL